MRAARKPARPGPVEAAGGGRDVSRLLADFGHDLPTAPPPLHGRRRRGCSGTSPRAGRAGPAGAGRRRSAPVSAWRMTSDQAPVLWPFIATPGLPPTGAQMGIDLLSGGSFYADPIGWVLDDDIPVTNPNMFSFGKPGRGKSATIKAFCLRMMDFGYRALILGDPKDEYEPLCRVLGVRTVRDRPRPAGPDQPARVRAARSPAGTSSAPSEAQGRAAIVFGRWLTLIRGLVGSQRIGDQRVPFGPTDEVVVKAALRTLTGYAHGNTRMRETTIPQLWHLLDDPDRASWSPSAGTPTSGTSSTTPGCCATPSASSSPAPWPACSTTTPPSTSTGPPRSSRCPCPGSSRSATRRSASR